MNYEAFVYCWTDKLTDKLYVGYHKGRDDDGYICSSKIMKEEYKKRPQDFSRKIVAHGKLEDIVSLETKILQSMNAADDPQFYNKHNNTARIINGPLSEEHKEKIRKGCQGINRGRLFSETTREKISKSKIGTPAWNKGIPRDEETRKKISETRILNGIGKKENNPMFGKVRPDLAAKNKIPKSWINNSVIEKQIPKTEVSKYLGEGFVSGRLKK